MGKKSLRFSKSFNKNINIILFLLLVICGYFAYKCFSTVKEGIDETAASKAAQVAAASKV